MKSAWRFWVHVTSKREAGTAWALFRIAVGIVLVSTLVSVARSGVIDIFWVDVRSGGAMPLSGNWLVSLLGGATHRVVWGLFSAALAGAILVTLGLGGRASTLLALQTFVALYTLNFEATGGYDKLLSNALWLLFLVDGSATLSLDRWIASGKGGAKRAWTGGPAIAAWGRYCALLQIFVMYGATWLQKLSPVWTPFGKYSALYWVFQEPTWRRFDMTWVAHVYWLTQIATAVTWHFEMAAPFMILVFWFRATRSRPGRLRKLANRFDLRVPFAVIGVLLHVGILVALDVGPFSWISIAYYLCLWKPEEYVGVVEKARGWIARRPEEASALRTS